MFPPQPHSTLFPYTTLFRSEFEARIPLVIQDQSVIVQEFQSDQALKGFSKEIQREVLKSAIDEDGREDRKSTRLNSSHSQISYVVFCLKKKKSSHSVVRMYC